MIEQRPNRGLSLLLAASALVLSGCAGSDDEAFHYDRTDMEAAVHGSWIGTYTPLGGSSTALSLVILAPSEPRRSPQCASREFDSAASSVGLDPKCVSSSSLSVLASLSVDDGSTDSLELEGWFIADGYELNTGSLELPRAGGSWVLRAAWHRGAFSDCAAFEEGIPVANCTLDERAGED